MLALQVNEYESIDIQIARQSGTKGNCVPHVHDGIMCGRGEGCGGGKKRAAPPSCAESPDEALMVRAENALERFLSVSSEWRRRGDAMEATLVRLEQYIEQAVDQLEEIVQRELASGRRNRP